MRQLALHESHNEKSHRDKIRDDGRTPRFHGCYSLKLYYTMSVLLKQVFTC